MHTRLFAGVGLLCRASGENLQVSDIFPQIVKSRVYIAKLRNALDDELVFLRVSLVRSRLDVLQVDIMVLQL